MKYIYQRVCFSWWLVIASFSATLCAPSLAIEASRDISFYTVGTAFRRVLGYPDSKVQAVLVHRIWKLYLKNRSPMDEVLMPMHSGYNPDWVADVIVLPCMAQPREVLLAQFKMIDALIVGQNLDIKDLSWEQAYQLADHFLMLDESRFDFVVKEAPLEMSGVITERNSLLYYDPSFVSYLLGRTLDNVQIENHDIIPKLRETILAEVSTTNSQLKVELYRWLNPLSSTGSIYSILTTSALSHLLSLEARHVIKIGSEQFRTDQTRQLANFFTSRSFKGSAAERLYVRMTEDQRREFSDADLVQSGRKSFATDVAAPALDVASEVPSHSPQWIKSCKKILSSFFRN